MAKNTKTTESKTSKKKAVVKKTAAKSTASKTGGAKKASKAKAPAKKTAVKKSAKKPAAKKPVKATKAKKVTKKQTKKKAAPKKSATQKKEQSGGNTSRYFKVKYDNNTPTGRFSGTKPKQAANKALTSILKLREGAGQSTKVQIRFSIVECTRGSKHKEYSYVGERVELEKPMEVKIGKGPNAKTIKYRYNNKVFKDKVDSK